MNKIQYPQNYAELLFYERINYGNPPVIKERNYFPSMLIIHHSAGNDMANDEPINVIKFISDLHYKRFYNGKYDCTHRNFIDHSICYAAYHFLCWPFRKYPSGKVFNIVPTCRGVNDIICGGTTSYTINKQAIQLCVMGNYIKQEPVKVLIDIITNYFKPWIHNCRLRGIDPQVFGHGEIDKRTCPGKLMMVVDHLRKYIDNLV